MKDYIIPYCVANKDPWWTGVDIYNHSDAEQAITIKIYRHANGVCTNTITQKIKKYEHYLLLPTDIAKNLDVGKLTDGRAHIIITGPDNLMITPFMGATNEGKQGGFGILPVYTDTNLKN